MKTTDKKELQTKSAEDLKKTVEEAKKTLAQLLLDHAQNKLQNTRSIFNTRKEIAILKSVLQSKVKGGEK